jgi:transcriptional regulator with XRE-family HTH domain
MQTESESPISLWQNDCNNIYGLQPVVAHVQTFPAGRQRAFALYFCCQGKGGRLYMIIGEKIQQLRKSMNLTQEQLAEKLGVSRQAVSKWELGEALPDIENIVLLSKVFQVSTDYLLNAEINNSTHAPQEGDAALNSCHNLKTAAVLSTGICVIGLIMSFAAQRTWQSIFTVSIGLVIQIIGIVIFEVKGSLPVGGNKNLIIRKNFYALNVWLIMPFPVMILSDFLFSFYPRPRGYGMDLLCMAILYTVPN